MTTANSCLEMNYNLRKHQESAQIKGQSFNHSKLNFFNKKDNIKWPKSVN